MGEYLFYKTNEVKIGTCEDLYYVSYQKYTEALKQNFLSRTGSISPDEYAKPDSGFRFRFPFPDEDKLRFGNIIEPYDRGVLVKIRQSAIRDENSAANTYELLITQQKLIHREADGALCLAMVLRHPNGESHRIESEVFARNVIQELIRHHVTDNPDPKQKQFYREMAVRILKGYHIESPKQSQVQKEQNSRRVKRKPGNRL